MQVKLPHQIEAEEASSSYDQTMRQGNYFPCHAVLQELRLLDREYFKFLFRLVKRKAEEPFSPPSSMRRTEAAEGASMVCPDSPEHLSARRGAGADQAAERLIELAALFLLRVNYTNAGT